MRIDIDQLEFIDRTLRDLLLWLEGGTGNEETITSLLRMNDPGVHGTLPLRGTDLRCRDVGDGKLLETHVNANWLYDPARPAKMCAKLHGEGYNLHLHLQVHPNTERK
ncbi:MAG: hypothetical protein KAR40_07860 [Candidatus Sabulitectum sp.]|nr:hypothetical protein [Candidatus Sabulitectum sp.]